MRMGFELNLAQTQKLIMTPELRQAIQILQFNNVELMEYINKQLEVNPFLEVADKPKETVAKEEEVRPDSNKEEIDWKEIVEKYDDVSYRTYAEHGDGDLKQTFESYTSRKITLKEHLMMQLGYSTNT